MTIIGDATIAVDSDTSKFAKDVEDKTAAVAKKAAALFAATFGARAVVDFARDSIGAASDLNETVSKTQVVFGQASGSVLKFGETSAQAIGASKQEALGAAATFGNLLRSVGLTDEQAAKFSINMTQLAGDLASFNNVPVPEALDAIRAGLVGETEPLKRFGVNLNDATLKAKAMQLGLSDGKGVLDANAKAQAAYGLIMEQTTLAQGDFARTSGGLANQQRILAAEFDNVKASIGQQLLPVAIELVGTFRDALPEFQRLAGTALPALVSGTRAFVPVGQSFLSILTGLAPLLEVTADVITSIPAPLLTLATTGALLGSGMGPLPNLFKDFAVGMKSVRVEGPGTASAVDKVKGGMATLNPYVVAGTVALYALSKGMQEKAASDAIAAKALDDATRAFRDHAEAIGDDAKALAKARIEESGLQEELTDLGLTYDDLGRMLSTGQEGVDSLTKRFKDHGGVSKELALTILSLSKSYQQAARDQLNSLVASEDLTRAQVRAAEQQHRLDDGTTDYVGALRQLEPGLAKAEDGTAGLTKAVDTQTVSLEVQEKQLKDTMDALDAFLGRQVEGEDLVIKYEAALDDLTEGLKENGATLDVNTDKGRANLSGLRDVRESIIAATEARYRETRSADEAAATTEMMIGRLRDELRQRGLSKQAVDDYVAALKLTPKDVRTQLIVNADEAAGKLAGFATLVKVIGQEAADKFVEGFTQGLRDGEGRLVTSADSAAARIEQAVRGRLQQRSPSRVGVDIGRNFAESIGMGIDQGSTTSEEAITRLGTFMEETIYRAAMVTQEEEAAILRAHQAIISSQERLNAVREDAAHTAEDLRLAELEVSLAQEEYNRVVDDSTSATGALADAQEALEGIAARVREQVQSVFGAFSAGFASMDAAGALSNAKNQLVTLRREQATLPGAIEAAEKRLSDAQRQARRTTATEELAIIRARERVTDAEEKLTKAQADATTTATDLRIAELELKIAQQQLAAAREDAEAPTRDVTEAERALTQLREQAATISDRVRDAQNAVTEAQVRAIEATERQREATAALIGQGPDALAHFRDMAEAAGLTRREINDLVDSLRRLNDSGGATRPPGSQNPVTRPITGPKQPATRSGTVAEELQRLANKSPNSVIIGENGQRVVFQPGAVQVGVMDTSLVMAKLNVQSAMGQALTSAARLRPANN